MVAHAAFFSGSVSRWAFATLSESGEEEPSTSDVRRYIVVDERYFSSDNFGEELAPLMLSAL